MPPYQSHEASVLNVTTLLIDSDFRLSWSNNFSADVTPNIQSDILLHIMPYKSEEDSKWITHTIRKGSARSPESISHGRDIGRFVKGSRIVSGIFEVVTNVTGLSTTDSFSFSRWTGVYLIAPQMLSSLSHRMELGSLCNVTSPGGTVQVPACPITEFRARRFNSGFNEEKVVSSKEAMYSKQYYSYLHQSSKSCFVQFESQEPR